MAIDKTIRAAGAVVTRGHGRDREYLLVHRNYRSDWSFPKGKLDPAESVAAAAVREVREETGFAIQLGMPLPTQSYKVEGAAKVVHYWHGEVLGGNFMANDEVDEVRWLSISAARELLTYKHDVDVLNAAEHAVPTSPLIVLRHTQAMKRADWSVSASNRSDRDAHRPLTAVGRIQAASLIPALAAFGISEVHSSDSTRCRDTVGPYATARSLAIDLEFTISEEQHTADPDAAQNRIVALASAAKPVVVCTHRPVLPTVMSALSSIFHVSEVLINMSESAEIFDPALSPGSMVVYHRNPLDLQQLLAVELHLHGV